MNILVTGGAGYIGSHTCLELLESGYGVIVIDNLCNSNPKSLERVEELTGKKVKFYEGDVRDEALLRKIFASHEIGCVIHFAGLKAVGESVAMPWEYYDNNLNTTLVLTKVMKEVGMKNIIFSSSATVYTGDNEMPLKETSRTGNCTNPYGWTKYMTEQILSGIAHADKEWGVCLLRYFNPIGAHESGMIGEDPQGVPNNLMPYITQVARRHRRPGLHPCGGPGQGSCGCGEVCHHSPRLRCLQPGYRHRLQCSGHGEHLPGGQQCGPALCDH